MKRLRFTVSGYETRFVERLRRASTNNNEQKLVETGFVEN
jgi:ribosomal protein S17E